MRFRALAAYSAMAYFNQFATALLNLLFIKILPLNTLGEIAIAKVWMQVMDYSHLGLRFALDRYVPVWERQLSAHLLWVCIGVSSLVSVAIMGVALIFTDNKLMILAFCIWGYGGAIATIVKNYYRALSDLKQMLATYVACPTIPVVAQTAAFYFWGFNGFLTITVLTSLAAVTYLLISLRSTALEAWRHIRASLGSVRSAATTLFINSIVIFLTFSVDRVVLNAYSSKDIVGEYSIVLFAFSLLLVIPSTIAEFIFPKVVRSTLEDNKLYHPREILSILIPTASVVIAAYFLAPYFITAFTPYGHLGAQIQLATIGILPYAVTPVLFHVMSAKDMRTQLILSSCTVLCVYTLALLWGGTYASNKLEFFTLSRVLFGYVLLIAYWFCITLHRRKII